MPYVTRHRITMGVTVSGGASQSFYSTGLLIGLVEAVQYTPASASGISTAAGLLMTADRSGLTIMDVTATGTVTHYPRAKAEDVSGGALGYTSAATPPAIPVQIPLAQERARVKITSGGAASGTSLGGTIDLYISGI